MVPVTGSTCAGTRIEVHTESDGLSSSTMVERFTASEQEKYCVSTTFL
jgi:hypothetical protein